MSILRETFNGPIWFECDNTRCVETCETHCCEFSGALAKAKSRGWKVLKIGGEWMHSCPDCVLSIKG